MFQSAQGGGVERLFLLLYYRILKINLEIQLNLFYRQGQVAVIGRWPLFRGLLQIWESVWD